MKMCDQSTSPSKVMSAFTSLVTSLMPNALDLPQINQLICNLIQLSAINGNTGSHSSTGAATGLSLDSLEMRRERHRKTERVRHNKTIELIRQLSQLIGLNDRHETQANILNRSARYVLFLSYVIDKLEMDSNAGVDILSDEWYNSLEPLYQRALEEASKLIQTSYEDVSSICDSDVSQQLIDSYFDDPLAELTETRDHCLSFL